MNTVKKAVTLFNGLSPKKKIQLIAALMLTIALLIMTPTLAWFGYQRRIVKLQKVESPNTLVLSAAHREDAMNFVVDGIDADEILVDDYGNKILDGSGNDQKITYKDYVFCVTGDSVEKFMIQLAYTTNNQFTYELYAANEYDESQINKVAGQDKYVVYTVKEDPMTGLPIFIDESYHPDAASSNKLYYAVNTTVSDGSPAASGGKYSGTYLNSTNGLIANTGDTYYEKTYDDYAHVQGNAVPVYWQATNLDAIPGETNPNKKPFSRHFILRVKWQAGTLDNKSKETDIVYITVKATGS